ncbi:hypothetical protein Vretimale_10919 [Volvox reticuliferus]|uniref:Uncharacterized protein n=1 Tax=Volvox reticuliferus TaxID=1737510 RepID=A0A8J4CLB1_9CHLO|nr:hypothetical protein Vretifemale_12605 [Volvox reticuliferus]GIM06658.1 hypothetical protein Vretimale_10919 [Volvox reticuliferus]
MASSTYQTYHAGVVYLALRQDLEWELLTPHARAAFLKCNQEEQPPKESAVPFVRKSPYAPSDASRFYSWLYRAACDASPTKAAADNSLTCDRAFSGGRLVPYRYRTFVIIGGNQISNDDPALPLLPPQMPLQQKLQRHTSRGKRGWEEMDFRPEDFNYGGDDIGDDHDKVTCNSLPRRGRVGGGGPSGGSCGPGGSGRGGASLVSVAPATWAGELLDQSRIHEAMKLRPLVSPVRLLLGSGAAFWEGVPAPSRQLRTMVPPSSASLSPAANCTLPPLEGCAVAVFGSCILVHGGMSPTGEATDEMRAFRLQRDLRRPGEYEMVGRVRVQQEHGGGCGAPLLAVDAPRPRSAWWLPDVITGVDMATASEAAANTSATASCGGGTSRPCPPPSARHSHHMAVDSATSRLWMFGGCCGTMTSSASGGSGTSDWRRQDATFQLSLPAPLVPNFKEGRERRVDLLPCCFWAQLPTTTAAPPTSGTSAAAAAVGKDGGKAGSSSLTVTDCGCGEDDLFPGGDVVVSKVEWHCLPLRSLRNGDGGGGASSDGKRARGVTSGPPFPDATRVATIAVHDGGLFVLSSGLGPAGSGGSSGGADVKLRSSMALSQVLRWWLHRIDLETGVCELLSEPVAPLAAAGGGVSVTTSATAAASQQPPLYHDDAVAMADDTLPYIYVYGSKQFCSGPASLAGGTFVPSLHRVRLGSGGSGVVTSAAGCWEAVELSGTARLHVARKALCTASGGTVVLVGGVRDVRKGVEAQVQVVVPVFLKGGGSLPSGTDDRALRASRRPLSPGRHVFVTAALAQCRRVIAERLKQAAPGMVRFANPNAPVGRDGCRTGEYCHTGGCGAGDGGVAGVPRASSSSSSSSRPCVALAAALSLYSRGGLFDEVFFQELDDLGDGGGGGGMTMPGHDPLAVAAAVAWVMGRTYVRTDWEPRFLLQVFRVAHCWELAALQREIVALVACLAPLLPLQQIPAALGLWGEMRRLGAVGMMASSSSSAAAMSGSGVRVEAELRSRMEKAASTCRVTVDNMEEVMEAVMIAEAEEAEESTGGAAAGGIMNYSVSPLAPLREACLQIAEELLAPGNGNSRNGGAATVCTGGRGGSSSDGSTASIGAQQVEGARIATRFACRFEIWPLLFQAMRWWRRRLVTSLKDEATLDHLLGLLSELKDIEKEVDVATSREGCIASAVAGAQGVFASRSPLKRPRLPQAPAAPGSKNHPLGTAGAPNRKCAARAAGAVGATVEAKAGDCRDETEEEQGEDEDAAPLISQLRGYLWGELLRCLRPQTALAVLEALDRSSQSDATTACEIRLYVQQKAYDMLAVLPPAQRVQLPTKSRTQGKPEHEALQEASVRAAEGTAFESRI